MIKMSISEISYAQRPLALSRGCEIIQLFLIYPGARQGVVGSQNGRLGHGSDSWIDSHEREWFEAKFRLAITR